MQSNNVNAWVCPVCGYIHHGQEPPEFCPVCGVERDLFEPYMEGDSSAPSRRWTCPVCGHIHEGTEPPDLCPVCGVTGEEFEPYEAGNSIQQDAKQPASVVVIGAGIAGTSAAESLRKTSPQTRITLISNEAHLPYYRLNLTRYLAGEVTVGELLLHPEGWYSENDIEFLLNTHVTSVDLAKQVVMLEDGKKIPFERLILTAGANAFVPPIQGADRGGVTTLRRLEDADRILDAGRKDGECVCIGGGLLGLETAGALARRGMKVIVLEAMDWLLPRQLNQTAALRFEKEVRDLGINLKTGAKTREIAGNARVDTVLLEDGTRMPASLVVISAGVRSNLDLARQAGLAINQGLLVDDHMLTSHPAVFAAGDAVEHQGLLYGTWGPSQGQGVIAGLNTAGQDTKFHSIPRSNTLKVLGIDLFSIGRIQPEKSGEKVVEGESAGGFCSFLLEDTRLAGAILLGDVSMAGRVKKHIETQADLPEAARRAGRVKDILDYFASS